MAGRTVRSQRHNLPVELTSFVGRRHELSEVKRLLTTTRLLTLTGTGGAGKTRLALRAAADSARNFPDGVWLVPLAPIEDPLLVSQAVFNALGLQDRSAGWSLSALTDYLAGKRALLVLDNCEHLLDSCAVLANTLLRACPDLRVLATSRQALGTAGELRMPVPPLSLPEDGSPLVAERLVNFDAVALLAERATAVLPGFKIAANDTSAVLALCRRLDGIPLALELAAVRLAALSPDQLNQALDRELSVLGEGNRGAEPRQQTLEATIGWSYRLLTEQERRLWATLSVFAGGFDEEAAIKVCTGPELPAGQIVKLLANLVEKSILTRDAAAQPTRYMLLETVRQYGRQQLRELGAEIEVQGRHRDWILGLSAPAGAWDHQQAAMFNRIHLDRDNVWAALDFCLRQKDEALVGIEICWHLNVFWQSRGPLRDSRRTLAQLLEQAPTGTLSRAHALMAASALAIAQNDFLEAGRMATESLRVGRELDNAEVIAWSLIYVSLVSWAEQKTTEALGLAQSALAIAKTTESPADAMNAMDTLCAISLAVGDLQTVVDVGEEALAISVRLGELWARGYLINFLSQARWQQGDRQRAEALAKEGCACKHSLHDWVGFALLVDTLASMAVERGAPERAAILLGCAQRTRELVGASRFEALRAQQAHGESLARGKLGEVPFASFFDRGRAMTIDKAFAFAMDEKEPTKPAPPIAPEEPMQLTRRELEIARLIADGMTTREIASKLFISDRTVETHVTNMLNKLGLGSRIQLTRWVVGLDKL